MHKWYALLLLILGVAAFVWAMRQERSASLDNLPIVIIAAIVGVCAVAAGILWLITIAFERL